MKALFFFLLISVVMVGCVQKPATLQEWTFTRELQEKPRGGTTTGAAVQFDQSVSPQWKKMKEKGLSDFARDRRAILALTGVFQTKFEFLESFAIDPKKKLDVPYRSWGTEWVFPIEEREDFISLQHIMVMYFVDPKTQKVTGPMVMKHWRQDWTWQAKEAFVYLGKNTWKKHKLSRSERRGKWLWSVYQVDDSLRYEGLGQWYHDKVASTFSTERLYRPLPRREKSFRKDYDILVGKDQLILTPYFWFHEQKNWKFKGHLDKKLKEQGEFLSRELGHNSYKRLEKFNDQAAKDYWKQTKDYWRAVRETWEDLKRKKNSFLLKTSVGGEYLFARHFQEAEGPEMQSLSFEEKKKRARATIEKFLR